MISPETIFQILIAAGPYVTLCAVLAICLYRDRVLRRESQSNAEAVNQRAQSAERRLEAAEAALTQVQSQLADLEEQAQLASGAPAKSWTNINRRTQAVRMLRSGNTPSGVAAELSMSRAEVELIRKVHTLTANSAETPSIFSVGG